MQVGELTISVYRESERQTGRREDTDRYYGIESLPGGIGYKVTLNFKMRF